MVGDLQRVGNRAEGKWMEGLVRSKGRRGLQSAWKSRIQRPADVRAVGNCRDQVTLYRLRDNGDEGEEGHWNNHSD